MDDSIPDSALCKQNRETRTTNIRHMKAWGGLFEFTFYFPDKHVLRAVLMKCKTFSCTE